MNNLSSGEHPPLFDLCINLDNAQFDRDRDEMLERARTSGVPYLCLTGSSLLSSQYACLWARKAPSRFCATSGIHPHEAGKANEDTYKGIEALLDDPVVRAVGECGLDYNRNFSPKLAQQECFNRQIDMSNRHKLPLFLHQRDAHDDFIAILRSATQPMVVHCFTDTLESLRSYLDRGCYIGITGWICDPKRGENLRSIVKYIPLDRLMIETDAPWLCPKDMRPKPAKRRNEPMFLPHILNRIAYHMNQPADLVAEQTTRNALLFFGMTQCNSSH